MPIFVPFPKKFQFLQFEECTPTSASGRAPYPSRKRKKAVMQSNTFADCTDDSYCSKPLTCNVRAKKCVLRNPQDPMRDIYVDQFNEPAYRPFVEQAFRETKSQEPWIASPPNRGPNSVGRFYRVNVSGSDVDNQEYDWNSVSPQNYKPGNRVNVTSPPGNARLYEWIGKRESLSPYNHSFYANLNSNLGQPNEEQLEDLGRRARQQRELEQELLELKEEEAPPPPATPASVSVRGRRRLRQLVSPPSTPPRSPPRQRQAVQSSISSSSGADAIQALPVYKRSLDDALAEIIFTLSNIPNLSFPTLYNIVTSGLEEVPDNSGPSDPIYSENLLTAISNTFHDSSPNQVAKRWSSLQQLARVLERVGIPIPDVVQDDWLSALENSDAFNDLRRISIALGGGDQELIHRILNARYLGNETDKKYNANLLSDLTNLLLLARKFPNSTKNALIQTIIEPLSAQ